MTTFSLIITTLVILQFLHTKADRPKCTIIIFRHGYENSFATFKDKRYRGEDDWEGFKELITTRGMKQLYDVGKSKRERYGHLLGPVYDPFQITVTSTNTKTATMSAQAFLAGLYPVNDSLKFDPEIAWRPTPVHTIPIEENDFLYRLDNCPKHKYFTTEVYDSIRYNKWKSDYQWVKWIIQNNTNVRIESNFFVGLANIYYTLRIQELQNGTPPAWTREIYPDPLRTIYGIAFEMNVIIDEMARLAVGTTVLKIFNDLYAMHKNKQSQKVIIHSTHDVIIPYLLHALHLKYKELPLFGAYLQFELVDGMFLGPNDTSAKDTTGIQITYNGEPLRVPGCGHFCPFFQFRKMHEHLYVQNFKNACHHNPDWPPLKRFLPLLFPITMVFRKNNSPSGETKSG